MARLKKKFIEDGAIGASQILLENDSFLTGRNAGDSADIDIIKVDSSDGLQLAAKVLDVSSAAPTVDAQLANKKYVDDQIATISIPSVFELQGNWNATTNTPTLDDTDTSVDNFLYYVTVAGSVDFGAGSITFSVGDWVYNANGTWQKADNNDDVLSVNGATGVVVLDTDDVTEGANKYYATSLFDTDLATKDTDDLSEGSVNLYHTTARARAAAVLNTLAGSETDQAPSVDAVNTAIAAIMGADAEDEVNTLDGTDISNGFIDLGFEALAGSIHISPVGGPVQEAAVDYTISLTGGAGGVTRITFAGDLVSELAATDKLMIKYLRG